jgi:hypothetical protein
LQKPAVLCFLFTLHLWGQAVQHSISLSGFTAGKPVLFKSPIRITLPYHPSALPFLIIHQDYPLPIIYSNQLYLWGHTRLPDYPYLSILSINIVHRDHIYQSR